MSHLSELENRLSLKTIESLSNPTESIEDVYYIKYPYYTSLKNIPTLDTMISDLNFFIEHLKWEDYTLFSNSFITSTKT